MLKGSKISGTPGSLNKEIGGDLEVQLIEQKIHFLG